MDAKTSKMYELYEKAIVDDTAKLAALSEDYSEKSMEDHGFVPYIFPPEYFEKIIDAFYPDDSDLDGAPDWRDELNGTNDFVDKIYLPDGTILAEVNDGVWAVCNADGSQRDGYFTRTLSEITTGSTSVQFEAGTDGASVSISYTGPEGTYVMQLIDYPTAIVVEGSPY